MLNRSHMVLGSIWGGCPSPTSHTHNSRSQGKNKEPAAPPAAFLPIKAQGGVFGDPPGQACLWRPVSCFLLTGRSWPQAFESCQNPPVPSFKILFFDWHYFFRHVSSLHDKYMTLKLLKHTSFANRMRLRVTHNVPKF